MCTRRDVADGGCDGSKRIVGMRKRNWIKAVLHQNIDTPYAAFLHEGERGKHAERNVNMRRRGVTCVASASIFMDGIERGIGGEGFELQ